MKEEYSGLLKLNKAHTPTIFAEAWKNYDNNKSKVWIDIPVRITGSGSYFYIATKKLNRTS
jgi:hypothetical protein